MAISIVMSYLMPSSHVKVKPAETKPEYRMEPSDWTIHQIECIWLAEIQPGLDKTGLAVSMWMWYTVKAPLSPQGAYLSLDTPEGGLLERGAYSRS